MSGYTKGTWSFDSEIRWVNQPGEQEIHSGNYEVYSEDGETIIASVNGQIAEGKANARLIAAVPELMQALKRCVEAGTERNGLIDHEYLRIAVWMAQQAIAKAVSA